MRKGLEEVLTVQLSELLQDYDINITEDINYWLDNNDFNYKDILIVITQGNATRNEVGNVTFFNSSAMLQIYCDLSIKEKIMFELDKLFNLMSKQGKTFSANGYTFAFNFNTCSSDSISRVFAGSDVAYIQGICSYTSYSNMKITEMPRFKIIHEYNQEVHEVLIEPNANLISFVAHSSSQTDDNNCMGSRFVKRFENIDSVSYVASVILDDKTRDLEKIAMKYSQNTSYFSNKIYCEIAPNDRIGEFSTGLFESFLDVSLTYNIGNFSVIDLIIMR